MPLLSHGAHIDFRGKDGLTPLHRAALGGNSAAIKVCRKYQYIVVTNIYAMYNHSQPLTVSTSNSDSVVLWSLS